MKKNQPARVFRLEGATKDGVKRTIEFIPNGRLTYLWIGDERLYGSLSGQSRLRLFATELLAALDRPRKPAAKRKAK